jgi:hypothetical protein
VTTDVDPKWRVPESYDIEDRAFVAPPLRGVVPTAPVLGMLSIRALEEQATGDGMFSLIAWQLKAGAATLAAETLARLDQTPGLSGIEQLMLAHAHYVFGDDHAFEHAQRTRKVLKTVDAGLTLAATALPHGAERVRILLDKLEPELAQATDAQRAVLALIRAAAEPAPAQLDAAYAQMLAIDDAFGLAQCALLAHAQERANAKRPPVMRAYLEHAVYRYEADGRPEWAALVIAQGLVPLLVDELDAPAEVVGELFSRAAGLALEANALATLESVFRLAARCGYAPTLTSLSQLDPPTFARRGAAPPTAPVSATASPAEAAKPKKAAAGKKTKKRT